MTTVQDIVTKGRKVLKIVWAKIELEQFNMIVAALRSELIQEKTSTIGLVTNQPLLEITYRMPNADIPMIKEVIGHKNQYFVSEPYMEEED